MSPLPVAILGDSAQYPRPNWRSIGRHRTTVERLSNDAWDAPRGCQQHPGLVQQARTGPPHAGNRPIFSTSSSLPVAVGHILNSKSLAAVLAHGALCRCGSEGGITVGSSRSNASAQLGIPSLLDLNMGKTSTKQSIS